MLWIVLALIVGVVLGVRYAEYSTVFWWAFAIVAIIGAVEDVLFSRNVMLVILAFVVGGYVLARYSVVEGDGGLRYGDREVFVLVVESVGDEGQKWITYDTKIIGIRDSIGQWRESNVRVKCSVGIGESFSIADTVSMVGKVYSIEGGYGHYLRNRGILGKLYGYDAEVLGEGGVSVRRWIEDLRVGAANRIYSLDSVGSQSTALMAAMAVGTRGALSRQSVEEYRDVGASHLLAISGLHIGIVVAMLNFILGGIRGIGRRGRVIYSVVIIGVLWGYAVFSGMSVSVVRAATMFSLYQTAILMHRSAIGINVLSAAAFIIILINPLSIYDIGFQLSFAAMVGISIFYYPLLLLWSSRYKLFRILWAALCVSLSAQLTVAPLVAYHFGNIQLMSLPLTLIIWLTVPVIIVTSIVYLVSSIAIIGHIGVVVAGIQNWVFGEISQWSWIVIRSVELNGYGLLLWYIVVALLGFMLNYHRYRAFRRKAIKVVRRSF